jgi:hypothetical protein
MQDASSPARGDLALLLGGGLLLLSAWTLATVSTYSESSTYCPSWLGQNALDLGRDAKFCTPVIAERGRLVLLLAAVGVLLVVIGALRGRSAIFDRSTSMGTVSQVAHSVVASVGLTTIIWAVPLLAAALVVVGAGSREWEDLVRAGMSVGIATAGCVVAAIATVFGRRGHRLTFDHSMTALSLSTPLLALVLLDLDTLGVTEPGEIDPGWTSAPARFLLCGVPVSICLWVLVSRQNRRLLSPPAGVAGLALLGSATALFIAMTPDAFGGGWGLGSDQSPWRFTTWVGIAVLLPWVVHGAWSFHHRATAESSSPDGPQSVLA